MDTSDCLMLHNFEDYGDERDAMHKIFDELKSQNVYKYSAISAYSRPDYGVIAESGFDAVQVQLTKEQLALLRDAFTGIDPRVTNPGMWYNSSKK